MGKKGRVNSPEHRAAISKANKGRRKGNTFHEKDGIVYMTLNNDKIVMFDSEDLPKVLLHTWYWNRGYATTNQHFGAKQRIMSMHRLIAGDPDYRLVTDHIDGNTLNNRRSNLQHITSKENTWKARGFGESGVKGVYYRKDNDKWMVRLFRDGKYIFNTCFDTKEEAIAARNKVEMEYLNIVFNGEK